MIEFRSDSLRETSLFARKLLSEISPENKVISFSGCLGSGKTFICNEILSHLNVEQLNSSSFQVFLTIQVKYQFFIVISLTIHSPKTITN